MKFRLLMIAGIAALTATSASAQGWNVSILGGPSFYPALSINGTHNGVDSGFNVGGRLGYDVGDDYGFPGLTLAVDTFYNQGHFQGTSSDFSSLSFMGNALYHFNFEQTPFGVYGGAGIGAVRTAVDAPAASGSGTVLGWQLIGGVDYTLMSNTSLFAEYRYLNAHNANAGTFANVGNTSNNLSFGVKLAL
ncbi:MAG: porin family protein [Alphaproteobacteria bacterium]|nr:porin family protein [Alphaproteobacteria bacterium]MBL6939519.1 porin family protein [Alphaproteobacteria bacterium]MBL7100107.1 porin family protein [Alphaproteobacteria bacterium]